MAADRQKSVARVILGQIAVDVTLEEVHTYSSSITDYLVEDGSSLSDNRRKNPDKLHLTVFISDYPIDEPASHADGVTLSPSTVTYKQKKELIATVYGVSLTVPGAFSTTEIEQKELSVVAPTAPLSRVQAVYDELRRMHDEGEIFDVITAYRIFPNMAIESISAPRQAEAAIEFTLELKAIRYATARRIALAFSKVPAAQKKVSKGKQTPKVVADEKRKSALVKLGSFVGDLLGGGA